jgi:hypothetical protein
MVPVALLFRILGMQKVFLVLVVVLSIMYLVTLTAFSTMVFALRSCAQLQTVFFAPRSIRHPTNILPSHPPFETLVSELVLLLFPSLHN